MWPRVDVYEQEMGEAQGWARTVPAKAARGVGAPKAGSMPGNAAVIWGSQGTWRPSQP